MKLYEMPNGITPFFLRKLNNNLGNNQAILQSDSIPNNFYIRTRFSLPVYVDKLIIYRIKILRYQQVT